MKGFLKTIIILFISMQLFTVTALAYESVGRMKDMEDNIYKHLENRDNNFTILYTGARKEFEDNIRDCITNAYSKDDYLERSWLEIKPKAKITQDGIETTLDVTYLTTKEQEEYIDNQLKRITESLINPNMSDLEKVKVINEYIIDRFDYDYTQKSISVYSALTTSLAVCQGYSMTAYKMFNYAGIESRIVVGKININTPHSWNLVKIQGNWYQLDVTNNDSIDRDKYFLIGDNDLITKGYIWDRSKYPKAPIGYYK
ncbi:transglutaminase-like domain-containing protein [Clostridium sp.]|uniref:transglutaminase domain-containing protein n=1 Tax=Clostridium sp. TaxID=1506 RepID=UPI002633C837|nr:transglutaminase-like domain-containing protein [Clostridium sp.]